MCCMLTAPSLATGTAYWRYKYHTHTHTHSLSWEVKSKVILSMLSFLTKTGDLAPVKQHHSCKIVWSIFIDTVLLQQCVCTHVCPFVFVSVCVCGYFSKGKAEHTSMMLAVPNASNSVLSVLCLSYILYIYVCVCVRVWTHTGYYLFTDKQ